MVILPTRNTARKTAPPTKKTPVAPRCQRNHEEHVTAAAHQTAAVVRQDARESGANRTPVERCEPVFHVQTMSGRDEF